MGLSTEPRIINVRPKRPHKPESALQRMRRLHHLATGEAPGGGIGRETMKTDEHGCSTCPRGQEQWEEFTALGRRRVQYDYRASDGRLFSCVAKSLDEARARRDERERGL